MVIAIFGLVATVILWLLAFFTFRDGAKANILELNNTTLKSKKLSFITGFSIAVTNPVMIVWWLIGEKMMKDFGFVSNFNMTNTLLFLTVGGLGLFSYLSILANMLYRAKKFISNKIMKKVNFGLGIVLVLLSFYFLLSSLYALLHY